ATTGSNGSATFTGLTLTGTAGSYTLSFGATGLTPATAGITLSAGAASKLALSTPPSSSAQSGVAFSQQPVVQVQDASGNPVSQSGQHHYASGAGDSGRRLREQGHVVHGWTAHRHSGHRQQPGRRYPLRDEVEAHRHRGQRRDRHVQ